MGLTYNYLMSTRYTMNDFETRPNEIPSDQHRNFNEPAGAAGHLRCGCIKAESADDEKGPKVCFQTAQTAEAVRLMAQRLERRAV